MDLSFLCSSYRTSRHTLIPIVPRHAEYTMLDLMPHSPYTPVHSTGFRTTSEALHPRVARARYAFKTEQN